MRKIWKSIFCCIALAMVCTLALEAQSQESSKEVIIIEKIIDESGNIISKKIIRSKNGDLTDAEIEKALEEANDPSSFQEMFDFKDLGQFNPNKYSKATLGVVLSFESGTAKITNISPGSGAEEAELQVDDIIVSVDGLVVNNIDDIKDYLKNKNDGDKVLLSIIRDDQSFEKDVKLKNNIFTQAFGNFNPESLKEFGNLFDFGNNEFQFDMDSLLSQFKQRDKGSPFQFELPNYSNKKVEEDRPSLGIFIEETEDGIIISEVIEGSAAEKAKLKVDDIILKIDGKEIKSYDDLARLIKSAGKNTKLLITYQRNGKTKEADVILN